MITKVLLKNFTSHKDTLLELGPGLNVFVGRNGSGKTSVLDGITYTLFGKHRRGSNVNIVMDGALAGHVEVEFTLDGKKYTVGRTFDVQGRLEDAYLRVDGKPLVSGERKKDDAVSKRIEKILRMGYERLRSAVIIQQGEIDRILSWEPKEIKELFDDLLGLDIMESAYERMKSVSKDFDERIRKETGYSVNDVGNLSKRISEDEAAISKLNEELRENERQLNELKEEYEAIKAELEKMERFRNTYYNVLSQISFIKGIVKNWIAREKEELDRCKSALERIKIKDDVDEIVDLKEKLKEEIVKLEKDIEHLRREIDSVKKEGEEVDEKLKALGEESFEGREFSEIKKEVDRRTIELIDMAVELGKSLTSRDGRETSLRGAIEGKKKEILELFDESYRSGIRKYLEDLKNRKIGMNERLERALSKLESLMRDLNNKRGELQRIFKLYGKDFEDLQEEIREAQGILKAASIDNIKKFDSRKERLEKIEKALVSISEDDLPEPELLYNIAVTDDVIQKIKSVEVMMPDAKSFNKERYENIARRHEELQRKIGELEGSIERIRKDIKEREDELFKLKSIISVLEDAKKFRDFLDDIRNKVYYRDGPVLKSLRSWTIREVSRFATEHLESFNINVDGIKLEEVSDEVEIKCYQRGREVDSDRLSGGEKVAVALALRLAIGDILGARRLGFFILDEPTVHLDFENKRRIAKVFSALSKEVRQVIVITHDEEVFEEAEATLYKFERRPGMGGYTKVNLVGRPAWA